MYLWHHYIYGINSFSNNILKGTCMETLVFYWLFSSPSTKQCLITYGHEKHKGNKVQRKEREFEVIFEEEKTHQNWIHLQDTDTYLGKFDVIDIPTRHFSISGSRALLLHNNIVCSPQHFWVPSQTLRESLYWLLLKLTGCQLSQAVYNQEAVSWS